MNDFCHMSDCLILPKFVIRYSCEVNFFYQLPGRLMEVLFVDVGLKFNFHGKILQFRKQVVRCIFNAKLRV